MKRDEHCYTLSGGERSATEMAADQGEFQLNVEPADKIIFKGKNLSAIGARIDLKITNPTKERHAFKVKCTSNDLFRIRPPIGILEPNASVHVQLTFHNQQGNLELPDDNEHFFVIYYTKAAEENMTPREVWTEHKGVEGPMRVFVAFHNEDDEHKDAKKDDKE